MDRGHGSSGVGPGLVLLSRDRGRQPASKPCFSRQRDRKIIRIRASSDYDDGGLSRGGPTLFAVSFVTVFQPCCICVIARLDSLFGA